MIGLLSIIVHTNEVKEKMTFSHLTMLWTIPGFQLTAKVVGAFFF